MMERKKEDIVRLQCDDVQVEAEVKIACIMTPPSRVATKSRITSRSASSRSEGSRDMFLAAAILNDVPAYMPSRATPEYFDASNNGIKYSDKSS